jgi:hypothetical protein
MGPFPFLAELCGEARYQIRPGLGTCCAEMVTSGSTIWKINVATLRIAMEAADA